MSKCSKKIKELKEKIDCVSGLDDDFVFMILCSIEKRINLIANYADEDELNGTCFNKNTQTADEMFFEIGYDEKEERLSKIIYYVDLPFFRPSINFNIRKKTVSSTPARDFTIQELKAIYKKCEELGWIE